MNKDYLIMNTNQANDSATLLKRWLENRNDGKSFVDYFHEYGCSSIIIFDAGEIGRLLYEEVKDSDIKVLCFYDRNAEGIREIDGIPVYTFAMVGEMTKTDMVVVSTCFNYSEVVRMLVGIDTKIRSVYMRDAVYEF